MAITHKLSLDSPSTLKYETTYESMFTEQNVQNRSDG